MSLIILVGLAVFVSASQIESYVTFNKGWNIITGFIHPRQLMEGDILQENIKAIYLLAQPSQEYIRVYPNPEDDKLAGLQDYYEQTPLWVYSDKSGRVKYNFEEQIPIEYWNEHKLYTGWNMVSITEEMIGDGGEPELRDLAGTCTIQKAYFFNPEQQNWGAFPLDEDFSEDALNMGIVLKVLSDCTLGTSGSLIPPPTLPN